MFTDAEVAYLSTQQLARLATVDPTGAPQNNPVGFRVSADEHIEVFGRAMAATRKWRNIATNPLVSIVVDDLADAATWQARGIEIRGVAEQLVLPEPPSAYAGRETIRIRPTRIISWGIEPGNPEMRGRTI